MGQGSVKFTSVALRPRTKHPTQWGHSPALQTFAEYCSGSGITGIWPWVRQATKKWTDNDTHRWQWCAKEEDTGEKITGGIGNSESMPKSGLSEKVTFTLRLDPEKESTVREPARTFKAEGTANTMNWGKIGFSVISRHNIWHVVGGRWGGAEFVTPI